jgi:hypothetical protein
MSAAAGSRRRRVSARAFYEQALDEAERADWTEAMKVEGVDQEIALLRLRLRRAVQQPEDMELMFKGIELLTRAVATRYRLSKQSRASLLESLRAATAGISPPAEATATEAADDR